MKAMFGFLSPHPPLLTLLGYLREPSEVKSLLYYLREDLISRQGAWCMTPKEDVRILGSSQWHVTFRDKDDSSSAFMPVEQADNFAHLFTRMRRQSDEAGDEPDSNANKEVNLNPDDDAASMINECGDEAGEEDRQLSQDKVEFAEDLQEFQDEVTAIGMPESIFVDVDGITLLPWTSW